MSFKPTDYKPYDFGNRRHIGPSPAEMDDMLQVVGAADLDTLIHETVPEGIRQAEELGFGDGMSERQLLERMREIAGA